MKYVVIITYSFDPDIPAFLFENEKEAWDFLSFMARKEYETDTKENGWNSELFLDEENGFAKITTHFFDGDDVTEMRITDIRN